MTMENRETVNNIKEALQNGGGPFDFRPYCKELTLAVQESLKTFRPTDSASYINNPIQLIDFFSEAGGMSPGFAALNGVVPALKMLGG